MKEGAVRPRRRTPHRVRRAIIVAVASVAALASTQRPAPAAVNYRTVALSGTQAPGTPSGARFQYFSRVLLTADGKAVFFGQLATGTGGVSQDNLHGIWSEAQGTLSLVAREGDQAPGTPTGSKFQFMDVPIIGPDGHVAFFSGVTGTSTAGGIWSRPAGGPLTLVARNGQAISGTPSGTLALNGPPGQQLASGAGNTTAFTARVKDSAVNFTPGVFYSDGATLSLLAQAGTQAAGLPTGANYGSFSYGMVRMDGQGKVTFFGLLEGPATTAFTDDAIWHGDANGLRLVARQGDAIPGEPAGTTFGNLGPPVVNASGRVAFRAEVPPTGRDMMSEGHGALAPVARYGDHAPGTPPDAKFALVGDQVAINDAGATAFAARLQPNVGGVTSADSAGIWSEGRGALALVARSGNQAPGTPDGAVFALFDPPAINGAGRVAFLADLRQGSGGVTLDNNTGLWAEDPDGVLSLVVREGDPFEVAPGNVRTIQSIVFEDVNEAPDYPGCTYTDAYTLAFALRFTDGTTGAFTATLVPEPGAMTVALLGGLRLCGRRRRRQLR